MDPDEYLKAKGRDEFLKIIGDTVPLAELVWRKNIQSKDLSTPEQKALIEKNIMEEVGKIADEKVRGYYIQEMKTGFTKNSAAEPGKTVAAAIAGGKRRRQPKAGADTAETEFGRTGFEVCAGGLCLLSGTDSRI